jgi:hypothetical protein
MSVEKYKLPGLFWRRNCAGLYLDVNASMNYADRAWFERNYPKMELVDARKYVQSALEKIANNPKAAAYRTAEFRRLEKKANAEFRSKSPEERDKWLRRYSRHKQVRENNKQKKDGIKLKPVQTRDADKGEEYALIGGYERQPEHTEHKQYLPKETKKDEDHDDESEEQTGTCFDDVPGQEYEPLEKVVLR